jgi:uncharacterized protein YaiI (UPF0178 family)
MNVIGTRPDGWWRDRDAAMGRLVKDLEDYAAATGDDITVVFERPPSPPLRSTVIHVTNAPRPGPDAADREIARLVDGDPDPRSLTVVTSDRTLAARVGLRGTDVIGAESFRARLD